MLNLFFVSFCVTYYSVIYFTCNIEFANALTLSRFAAIVTVPLCETVSVKWQDPRYK